MVRYVDLDKIVAEIERLKKVEGWCQVGKDTADVYYARGFRFACERILSFIDSLEVREGVITIDAFIEKALEFLDGCIPDYIDLKHANVDTFMNVDNKRFVGEFRKYMKGE